MKGKNRHNFIYKFARALCHRSLTRKFNFKHDIINIEDTPYIVAANHLTNWDPLLIGLSFKKSMYYVASDHILRLGFKSKLLNFALSPIVRLKTAQETQTVINIFRRLKEKCNVCIFAEGTTSFDGLTNEIQPSIGKLIKRAGVTLVTYRFTGSYFTFPRWARFIRKGKMQGHLVQIYKPEEIAKMSEEEIYLAIKNDLYANAYDEQEKNPVTFRGKKPAEYLETVLYCCPKCKQFGTLISCDDKLSCSCGLTVIYNELCYFESPDNTPPPFKTITDWVKWEREEAAALIASDKDLLLTDDNQELFEIVRASHNTLIAKGKLCLYKDRLSLISETGETIDFKIKDIADIGVIMMKTIVFAKDKTIYEIHSEHQRSALKYMDMIKMLKSI